MPANESRSLKHSGRQKKSEVEALMRCHGISLEKACEIVWLDPKDYLKSPPLEQSRIGYLPSPEEIARVSESLRLARPEFSGIVIEADCF